MKRSVAGSQNARITAFGYFCECVYDVVSKHKKGLTPKELFESLQFKRYRTLSVFKSSLIKYCNQGVIKNIIWDGKSFKAVICENSQTGTPLTKNRKSAQ